MSFHFFCGVLGTGSEILKLFLYIFLVKLLFKVRKYCKSLVTKKVVCKNRTDELKQSHVSQELDPQFLVGRLHYPLKTHVNFKMRVGGTAAMYLSAILEYLAAEILELAANVSNDIRTKHITPRRIQLAIRGNSFTHLLKSM